MSLLDAITQGLPIKSPDRWVAEDETALGRITKDIHQADVLQAFHVGTPPKFEISPHRAAHGIDARLCDTKMLLNRATRRARGASREIPPSYEDVRKSFKDEVAPPLSLIARQRVRYAQLFREVEAALHAHYSRSSATDPFLRSDTCCDFEHPSVRKVAEEILASVGGELGKIPPHRLAAACFDWVKDSIHYELAGWRRSASTVIESGAGSCSSKALVLVALFRFFGFPSGMAVMPVRHPGYLGTCLGPLGFVYDSLKPSTHYYAMVELPNIHGKPEWHRVDPSDDSLLAQSLAPNNWSATQDLCWDGTGNALLSFPPGCLPTHEQWMELLAISECSDEISRVMASWSAVGPVADVGQLLGGRVPDKSQINIRAAQKVFDKVIQNNKLEMLIQGTVPKEEIEIWVDDVLNDQKSKVAAAAHLVGIDVDGFKEYLADPAPHLRSREPSPIQNTMETTAQYWQDVANNAAILLDVANRPFPGMAKQIVNALTDRFVHARKPLSDDPQKIVDHVVREMGSVVGEGPLSLLKPSDLRSWAECVQGIARDLSWTQGMLHEQKTAAEVSLFCGALVRDPEVRSLLNGAARSEWIARLRLLGANQPTTPALQEARTKLLLCLLTGDPDEVTHRLQSPWLFAHEMWEKDQAIYAALGATVQDLMRWSREVVEPAIQVSLNLAIDMHRSVRDHALPPFEETWASVTAFQEYIQAHVEQPDGNRLDELLDDRAVSWSRENSGLQPEPFDLLLGNHPAHDDKINGLLAKHLSNFYCEVFTRGVHVAKLGPLIAHHRALFQFPHADRDLLRFVYWLDGSGKFEVASLLLQRLSDDMSGYATFGHWQEWNGGFGAFAKQIIVPIRQTLDQKHRGQKSPVRHFEWVGEAMAEMRGKIPGSFNAIFSHPVTCQAVSLWAKQHSDHEDLDFAGQVFVRWESCSKEIFS